MATSNSHAKPREVVITGLGVVSPIGIGRDTFWKSLREGRSGVRELRGYESTGLPLRMSAEVQDFEPKALIRPRKSLKVMSRDIQLGWAAADLATKDAGLLPGKVDPERMGVVFGADMIYFDLPDVVDAFRSCQIDGRFRFEMWGQRALGEMYPLWMLKYLPNMPACHIAIAHDARGPNNSITLGEVSSLLAVAEAMRVIERGQADVIIAGGTSSRVHPTSLVSRAGADTTRWDGDPAKALRPFDATRDGLVYGEGAAAFVLESRDHAAARGANVLTRVIGYSSTFEPRRNGSPLQGRAVLGSIATALRSANLAATDIGHVNAHGISTVLGDRIEAQAINEVLGEVPVTAPKSFFGNLGAGTGAVEMAASVLAIAKGEVPITLNYKRPDPECPVNVVHGEALRGTRPTAMVLNQATMGQAVAVVLSNE